MNEQAAHLVDRVLPQVPYRQWVLTLPGELARVVAFGGELSTAVFGVFADELSRWQGERANDLGIADPQTGSLLEIQRFADGARLYPHAHAVVPDGVFVASSDGLSARFIRQDPPSDEDVAHVVRRVVCPSASPTPSGTPSASPGAEPSATRSATPSGACATSSSHQSPASPSTASGASRDQASHQAR